MELIKLKEIAQNTWLRSGGGPEKNGVCYYMCNFIESEKGIWTKFEKFEDGVNLAKNFTQGTAMMNTAKVQNLRKAPQEGYASVLGALENNRIYRGQLWVGKKGETSTLANHEILIITGVGNSVAFFEPNFGFYQIVNADKDKNNRQSLEHFIAQLYSAANYNVATFGYKNVRSINKSTPLGFTA